MNKKWKIVILIGSILILLSFIMFMLFTFNEFEYTYNNSISHTTASNVWWQYLYSERTGSSFPDYYKPTLQFVESFISIISITITYWFVCLLVFLGIRLKIKHG